LKLLAAAAPGAAAGGMHVKSIQALFNFIFKNSLAGTGANAPPAALAGEVA
jgi:hypothetical protein